MIPNKTKKLSLMSGFTLVELIVVITILAILGTIGFISIQGYSSNARDSMRISDLKNMEIGFSLYKIKSWSYPDPESAINIEASGTLLNLQGYFGNSNAGVIGLSNSIVDPLDKSKYIYSVNSARTKYQIMWLMEWIQNLSFWNDIILGTAFAADSSTRIPRVAGDEIGIILNSNLSPISGTKIDLITTNSSTSYKVYFSNVSNEGIATTWSGIFTSVYNRQSELLKIKSLAVLDDSLVGYWDMETLTGTLLKDLSKYGNDGICYNSWTIVSCWAAWQWPQIVDGNGKNGKAMMFDGLDDYIEYPNSYTGNYFWSGNHTLVITMKNRDINNCYMGKWNNGVWWYFVVRSYPVQTTHFLEGWWRYPVTILEKSQKETYNTYSFTYNGTNEKAYTNGSIDNTYNNAGVLWWDLTPLFRIGGCYNWYYSNAILDEIRIYNRALTDAEIQAISNSSK